MNLTYPIGFMSSGGLPNWNNISTATDASKSFSHVGQLNGGYSTVINDDGTKLYLSDSTTAGVYQYTLSTAWDASTGSYASKSYAISEDTNAKGMVFSRDGTKMYVMGQTNKTLYQYTLSTAWDVSTASYDSKSFDPVAQASDPVNQYITDDGAALYIIDNGTDTVYQYTLSTPWDISTASYASKSFDASTQVSQATGLSFNPNGLQMYIQDFSTDTIYQYSLGTAWDVSTASYDSNSFTYTNPITFAFSAFYNPDGSGFYMSDYVNNSVYQFNL